MVDISELRSGDNQLNKIQQVISDLQKEEKDIDIPKRRSLNTEKIFLKDQPDGNIKLNGHWVHPLYGKLNNMMAEGESPIIIIVGKEGKGKSMTALLLCYYLHEKLNLLRGSFKPEQQTVYQPLEFLFTERDATRKAIMFDEANETLNSKEWRSVMNKAVRGALRTQRKRENCHVFVCPEYKQLDKGIRQKVDVLIEMKSKQFGKVRTYQMKHGKRGNRGLDYNYTEYPDWKVPDVPENLQKEYEEIDNSFKGQYLDSLLLDVLQEKMEQLEEEKTARL